MRRSASSFDPEELPAPICELCGFEIEEFDQDCVALDEGVCSP
jgi:hypothetical protein